MVFVTFTGADGFSRKFEFNITNKSLKGFPNGVYCVFFVFPVFLFPVFVFINIKLPGIF